MALGSTNITTAIVKTALSETTNNVSQLCSSANLNPWGINSPYTPQQNRCWGVMDQTSPYELGMFRGYDHNWRCYGTDTPVIDNLLPYYETGMVTYKIKAFPSWSTTTSGVTHTFDVYFSRTSSGFTNPSYYTKILSGITISDLGTRDIYINPLAPPDGGSALTVDSTVYLKVKHLSSDARRWDSNNFTAITPISVDTNDTNSWIITINIGHDIFTYYTYSSKTTGSTPQVAKTSAAEIVYITGYNGNRSDITIGVSVNINDNSSFTGSKNINFSGSATIPAATRSGGVLTLGTLDFSISGAVNPTQWAIGNTFYGRIQITSCTSGTYDSSWQTGYNGTVTSTLLL